MTADKSDTSLSADLRQQLDEIAIAEGFIGHTIKTDNNPTGGFMATMRAVTLVGDRKQADGTIRPDRLPLICKLHLPNQSPEQFDPKYVFEREVSAYNEILPALRQFQEEKGIRSAAEAMHSYPKCYAARNRTARRDAVIVLEDLRASNHLMCEKSQPVSLSHAVLMFGELGKLHGVSVAMREQRPQVYAEWERLPDNFAIMEKSKVIVEFVTSSFDRGIKLLGENEKFVELLRAFRRDWSVINEKCMDLKAIGAGAVLVHGDSWHNNVMYAMQNEVSTRYVDFGSINPIYSMINLFIYSCICRRLQSL